MTSLEAMFGPQPAWMQSAICPSSDPDAFFPDHITTEERAKRVCDDCPVRLDCLRYGLDNIELEGIWGGANQRERRAILRGKPIRRRTCPRGHDFTPENTYERPNGTRECKACRLARMARRKAEKAAVKETAA